MDNTQFEEKETKLVPAGDVKGDTVFHCERCLEIAKETNTEAPLHFYWGVGKYCPDCGSRFTNVTWDEDGFAVLKKEEE